MKQLQIELTWPGKSRDIDRTGAVLRPRERVGETQGPRNLLIHAENRLALASLLGEYAGRFDLIYIDPPFGTGTQFAVNTPAAPVAYADSWEQGLTQWLQMIYERLALMRELLSETGSIYVHCDWRTSGALRLVMDELFGPQNFLNEIVWLFGLGGSSRRYWPRKHNTLLWYSKTPDGQHFSADLVGASSQRMRGQQKKCPDYWDIPAINNMARERTEYATQKPLALLERVVRSSSPEGGLVGDFFCGSGTTGIAAQALGRRWVMCDESPWAVHVTRKRLLSARPACAFEIVAAEPQLPAGRIEAQVLRPQPDSVAIALTGYSPEQGIETGADWAGRLDYWAVDWDWDGEAFRNRWCAFRTRNCCELPLQTPPHVYPTPGPRRAMVRVFDVDGRESEVVVEIPAVIG